jgi:hypothetical protein
VWKEGLGYSHPGNLKDFFVLSKKTKKESELKKIPTNFKRISI